jgi:CDP-diacylglycerol--serine O-phosphatidyltransferase
MCYGSIVYKANDQIELFSIDQKRTIYTNEQNYKKKRRRRYSLKRRPITFFVPNILTLCGMCCGVTGIHMALANDMTSAIIAILIATFFDGIDGRVARKFGATSRFGAELDSLSDAATFGLSPAIIVYVYSLHYMGKIGWTISMLFVMCMSLRLARFNTRNIEQTDPAWMNGFGTGVPAPAGAYLLLLPLMTAQGFNIEIPAYIYGAWGMIVAGMLVSRIPTFLIGKNGYTVSNKNTVSTLIGIIIFLGAAYSFPWMTLLFVGITYLVSIPISAKKAYRKKAEILKQIMMTKSENTLA